MGYDPEAVVLDEAVMHFKTSGLIAPLRIILLKS